MNDKLKQFTKFYRKETEKGKLIKYLILSFILAIILNGLSVQSMLKASHKVNSVSFNPFKLLKYGTWDSGAYIIFLIGLFIAISAIFLIIHYKRAISKLGEEDNKISTENTELGSHHIATREEQDKVLETQRVEDVYDNILGWRGQVTEDMKKNAEIAKKNAVSILDGYDNAEVGPHWFLVGPPGSRKTSNFYISNIIQMIDRGESVILTDPKGELRKMLYVYAKNHGCVVKELNLIYPLLSDGVNFLDYIDNNDDARMVRDVVMKGLQEKSGKQDFWEKGEGEWILCIILYLIETKEVGDRERSLQGVHNFSLDNTIDEINDMMQELKDNSVAKNTWRTFKNNNATVNESFRTGVAAKLGVFNDPTIANVTSVSGDIDLTLPIKKQCVYFVEMSDTKTSNNFMANLFFSILFTTNIEYADIFEKTKVPINFILEEMCNIGEIPDIRTKLATIRSRGMRCFLCIQGYQQLEDTYDAKVGGFLDQVDNQIIFGINDNEKAKIIMDKAGKGTLLIHQRSQTEHTFVPFEVHPEYGDRTTPTQVDVLTIADILNMDRKKFILSLPGHEIMILNKFFWKWHPKADELIEEKYIFHTPKWWDNTLNDENLTADEREDLEKELDKVMKIREAVKEQEALPERKPKVRRKTVELEEHEVTIKSLITKITTKDAKPIEEEVEKEIEDTITEAEIENEVKKLEIIEEVDSLNIKEKSEHFDMAKDKKDELNDAINSLMDEDAATLTQMGNEEDEDDLAEILRKRQLKKEEEAKKRQKYRRKTSL